MKVNVLSDKISWFGKYSGYECLPDYYPSSIETVLNRAQYDLYNKVVGKYYKVQKKWNSRSEDIFNEIKFARKVNFTDASHILYLESHLHLLNNIKDTSKVFGTIHLPVSRWSESRLAMLEKLKNVILLYDEEAQIFSNYVGSKKVTVIKHGVDVDFFKPGAEAERNKNKVLFVGHFLRNFDMTLKVYECLCKEVSNALEFHFIIPSLFRNIPVLEKMKANGNVFFHEKLTDEELLKQYQTSNLLVMPMDDSGANTAIIQALSVGLPIVTTDVGGIRSYGGGDVFPLTANNDVHAMCSLIHRYLRDDEFRMSIGEAERKYSLANLDWNMISRQHIELYKQGVLQPLQVR